jgi:hypothetical protein
MQERAATSVVGQRDSVSALRFPHHVLHLMRRIRGSAPDAICKLRTEWACVRDIGLGSKQPRHTPSSASRISLTVRRQSTANRATTSNARLHVPRLWTPQQVRTHWAKSKQVWARENQALSCCSRSHVRRSHTTARHSAEKRKHRGNCCLIGITKSAFCASTDSLSFLVDGSD